MPAAPRGGKFSVRAGVNQDFAVVPRLPWWLRGQGICLQLGRPGLGPWVGKIPRRRKWLSTPVFLPGESHGWRSLVGYSPWGRKESNTTEQLTFWVRADPALLAKGRLPSVYSRLQETPRMELV